MNNSNNKIIATSNKTNKKCEKLHESSLWHFTEGHSKFKKNLA
jgi:hypothetical protein